MSQSSQFGYFVVQARADRLGPAAEVSGVLETLGTGDKTPFQSADDLARLLREWGGRLPSPTPPR